MANDFVFAYSSSMNRGELRSWLEVNGYDSSRIHGYEPARLPGYDYVWNYYSAALGGGAANIEPSERSSVAGVLIEFEDRLLKAFDRREGHPFFFSRGDRRIPVTRMSDGAQAQAWVYTARPNRGTARDLWPTRDYKKIILDAAVEFGFPPNDIEKIRNWTTCD
jgi:hypothetical protein